jgi:hypothetical protein
MERIYKAVDGTEFKSKLDCKNHEAKLNELKNVVLNALNSGVFGVMKSPERKDVPLLDSRNKPSDYRYNCGDGFSGFKIYDRYGYKIHIVFKLRGRRLKILRYAYDECETWVKYCGSVYLKKL